MQFSDVDISINNTKQVFNFTTRIHVRNQQSCFQGINIRGGSSTTTTDPVEVQNYIILSANATIICWEKTQFFYNWRLFKVESPSEIPKPENEIALKTSFGRSEIVFKGKDLRPGIYLIFVTVSQTGTTSSAPDTEKEDFAIFKIVQKRLEIFIWGGKRREIGEILFRCFCCVIPRVKNRQIYEIVQQLPTTFKVQKIEISSNKLVELILVEIGPISICANHHQISFSRQNLSEFWVELHTLI